MKNLEQPNQTNAALENGIKRDERAPTLARVYALILSWQSKTEPAAEDLGRNTATDSESETSAKADVPLDFITSEDDATIKYSSEVSSERS